MGLYPVFRIINVTGFQKSQINSPQFSNLHDIFLYKNDTKSLYGLIPPSEPRVLLLMTSASIEKKDIKRINLSSCMKERTVYQFKEETNHPQLSSGSEKKHLGDEYLMLGQHLETNRLANMSM